MQLEIEICYCMFLKKADNIQFLGRFGGELLSKRKRFLAEFLRFSKYSGRYHPSEFAWIQLLQLLFTVYLSILIIFALCKFIW